MGDVRLAKTPCRWARCPATDFEQVPGAAQAALRVSRVVRDIARGVGLGELCCLICVEIAYRSYPTAKATRWMKPTLPPLSKSNMECFSGFSMVFQSTRRGDVLITGVSSDTARPAPCRPGQRVPYLSRCRPDAGLTSADAGLTSAGAGRLALVAHARIPS